MGTLWPFGLPYPTANNVITVPSQVAIRTTHGAASDDKTRVSYQKGPTRHAYAWQIGPFWQDTLGKQSNRRPSVLSECSNNRRRQEKL